MEVGVGFAGFADPKEQVECSVCHKTATYGDVMRSWWGTNQGVLTCGDCVKKALGPENWERVRAEIEAMWRAAGQEPPSL